MPNVFKGIYYEALKFGLRQLDEKVRGSEWDYLTCKKRLGFDDENRKLYEEITTTKYRIGLCQKRLN